MNPRYIGIFILLLLVAAFGIMIFNNLDESKPQEDSPVACTLDAKICPDGTAVGRVAPNCEFAECPSPEASNASATATSSEDIPQKYVVTYTESGFIPETITIKKGETVTFVNANTKARMWVGSDLHPTHTIYPQKSEGDCLGSSFDQCAPTDVGTRFEFKFDQVGSWGYHNHVRANHTGKVIVNE